MESHLRGGIAMAVNKNARTIVLRKQPGLLLDYGFVRERMDGYYFYSGNKNKYGNVSWSICCIVNRLRRKKKDVRFEVCSHSALVLEVICKLYKDGIIDFVPYQPKDDRIAKKERQIEKLQQEIEMLKKELKDKQ